MKKPILILVLLSLALISCGRDGALYFPEEPQEQEENNQQDETK